MLLKIVRYFGGWGVFSFFAIFVITTSLVRYSETESLMSTTLAFLGAIAIGLAVRGLAWLGDFTED